MHSEVFINKYDFQLTFLWCHNDSPILICVLNCALTKLYIRHCNVSGWACSLHVISQNRVSAVSPKTLCLITPIKRVDSFVMQFVSNKQD